LRYDAEVIRDRRAWIVCAALGLFAAIGAAPVLADTTLPPNADVRVGSTVNLETFTRAIAARYNVRLHRVVAADIDRDGDVDFVAATDAGLLVWVNDGQGQLTAKTPERGSAPITLAPDGAWHGDSSRRELSVQNELPSTRVPSAHAHAPPPKVAPIRSPSHAVRFLDPAYDARISRAPPR
jgi:hypothetical protein